MQNYIKELYNFNKEQIELRNGLIPGSLQCTGDRYYIPIESNDPESMKRRENRILKRNDDNDSVIRRLDADEIDFQNFKDYDLKITDPEFESIDIINLMD